MPIEFACTTCQKTLRVPDGTEGQPCQCPACESICTIPRAGQATPTDEVSIPKDIVQPNSEDDTLTVTCPKCHYPLLCKPELLGTKGQCKQCKHIFVIGQSTEPDAPSSALIFSCPKCDQLFDGKPEMRGRKGRCHSCGEVFVIELRSTTPLPQPAARESKPSVFDQPSETVFGTGSSNILNRQPTTRAKQPTDQTSQIQQVNQAISVPEPTINYAYPTPTFFAPTEFAPTLRHDIGFPAATNYSPSMNFPTPNLSAGSNRSRLVDIAGWHRQLLLSLTVYFSTVLIMLILLLGMVLATVVFPLLSVLLFVALMIVCAVAMGVSVWSIIAFIFLCTKVYDESTMWLHIVGFFVGGIIPLLPFVLVFMALNKAKQILIENGVHVGSWGVKPGTI